VDVDVHHGDGVQDAFYDTGQVLTISLHQSGRTLFPGRGFVEETGRGQGEGACANIPLPPSTDDQAYLAAFDAIVPALVERFEPDVLVTQLGVDTHYLDPLANLALTTRGHRKLFEAFHGFGLPWLALGGGGYNLDVVPRAWTLAFAVMAGLDWPEELPPGYRAAHGGRWLEDREEPQMGDRVAELTRRRVEQIIRQVKELHGLA
jgi:acetoin utilization protein AcuC